MNKYKEFCDYMLTIGFEDKSSIYKWKVFTILGPIFVDIHDSDFNKNGSPKIKSNPCFGIYCRFVDHNLTQEMIDFIHLHYHDTGYCSGKFNFHVTAESKENWDYLVDRFKRKIEGILWRPVITGPKDGSIMV